jgi:O-antigen/teichoic acid export membrane protein
MNSQAESIHGPGDGAPVIGRKRPGIATHYLRYSISNGMVMLAGLISFPILTRFLSNTEFGILRYYDTLMLLGVALIKLGTPHAIVRFYPYDGDSRQMLGFSTNMVMVPLGLSVTLWALAGLCIAGWALAADRPFSPLFWCAFVMMPMMAAVNIVQMVVRASERSDIVMTTRIIGRMLELVFVLGAVIFVQRSALAVYGGKIVAGVMLLVWLAIWVRRNLHASRQVIDPRVVGMGLVYGLPLMAHELSFSVLANMDRVLLKHLTGDFAAVGIYAIGYALAMQLNVFIDATLSEAFTPVVTRAYESGGGGAVRALKERVLLPMTYGVVALVAMLLVSGKDMLVALSGPDKAASGDVLIIVGITISTYALFAIANYGLQLKKRTMQVLMITLGAALLNIAMNFILIPRMGYIGAAWSTAISYAALSVTQFIVCPAGLACLPGLRTAATSIGCGALLVCVALGSDLFGMQGVWERLFAGAVLFLALYALPVLALDPILRQMLLSLRARP